MLGLFCPKQGQGLKPSAAPLYPTIGQVPPPPPGGINDGKRPETVMLILLEPDMTMGDRFYVGKSHKGILHGGT